MPVPQQADCESFAAVRNPVLLSSTNVENCVAVTGRYDLQWVSYDYV